MNRWGNGNHKVLEDNSPLIDELLPALDTMDCLLNQEEEKVARKTWILKWKMSCWRKVPLELLCLVDGWIQTHKISSQKNLKNYWRNQALINQTGTFGPVMLRRMKIIVCNMLWNAIYLSRLLKTKLWTQIMKTYWGRNSTILNQNNHK